MRIDFDINAFLFFIPSRFYWYIPSLDIITFDFTPPTSTDLTFYFTWIGDTAPPFSFKYVDITLYQGNTIIPSFEQIVLDIQLVLREAKAAGKTKFQKFTATEGQTEFIVNEFTPSGEGLVTVNDQPNMDNWKISGNVYVFNAGLTAGDVVRIWQ
jgi:hypothetical protein